MTIRQTLLKLAYPLWMRYSKSGSKGKILYNSDSILPAVSFHTLQHYTNNAEVFQFEHLRGKKVLIVNTASNCGYTEQYGDLQKLQDTYVNVLQVIAFPSNDFNQEYNRDIDIKQFCDTNYRIKFPVMQKQSVLHPTQPHNVYEWLTSKSRNGWNDYKPDWNFSKYLVNETGVLTHYFGPAISPLSNTVKQALEL